MVLCLNGYRKSANFFSCIIVPLNLEFLDQYCRPVNLFFELGISISNLRTRVLGDRSHPYRKDRWRLLLFLWSSKSSGKPLWQLGDSTGDYTELGQYLVVCCLPFVIRMFNLSIMFICIFIMYHFVFYLWHLLIMF